MGTNGKNSYLSARILQCLGIVLLIGSAVFWAITGQQSSLFVGAAMSLITLGSYQGLRVSVKMEKERLNGTTEEESPRS